MSVSLPLPPGLSRYRTRLLLAMMLVAALVAAIALRLAERRAASELTNNLRLQFDAELAAAHQVSDLRRGALVERCRQLARKPRIHAAIEDDALDLLYLTARDELRDIIAPAPDAIENPDASRALHASFYRFLDGDGNVIPPPDPSEVGALDPRDEAALALPGASPTVHLGFIASPPSEVIAVPVFSSSTGQPVATLVLGFARPELLGHRPGETTLRGLWLDGRLHIPSTDSDPAGAAAAAERALASPAYFSTQTIAGRPTLVFHRALNPGSPYPVAHEICFYPLDGLAAHHRRLRYEAVGLGLVLLAGGYLASRLLAARLAAPVEKLAIVSAENQLGRDRAETALELTTEELQRAERFSSDASHQLKTPVAILRAGLEEFRATRSPGTEEDEELSALVHQTYRLSHIVDDLLLLSRLEAGAIRLALAPLDLIPLIEAALDDFTAIDETLPLAVEFDPPPSLPVLGESGYTSLILQNLFENARKYNHAGGRIRVTVLREGSEVVLLLGNTGPGIPAPAHALIFERFHRGAAGANTPGHGLGLNLARELARLHRGSLRLVRSDPEWTEFEVRFQAAPTGEIAASPSP